MEKDQYKIVDYSKFGMAFTEVYGDAFHQKDLYTLVGKLGYMTTFNLKPESQSATKYGLSITGTIFYSPNDMKEVTVKSFDELKIVKIETAPREFSIPYKIDLRTIGIKIEEIEYISYLPISRRPEYHQTGEKKVPNIIEVPIDTGKIDMDKMQQGYLIAKHNGGTHLAHFEKDLLIATLTVLRDGKVPYPILTTFGFPKDGKISDPNVWRLIYEIKKRRNILLPDEVPKYEETQAMHKIKILKDIYEQLKGTNRLRSSHPEVIEQLKKIYEEALSFRPEILVHGKNQIFWEVDNYIHILMRHVQKYQIGNYKIRTPLPYKVTDLEDLIKGVLGRISDEYKFHTETKPKTAFSRKGKWSVYFNGDHYQFWINPNGKLVSFHSL